MRVTLLCLPGKNSDKDSGAMSVGDERLAELGKPRLGEVTHISIVVKESQEFKVSIQCQLYARSRRKKDTACRGGGGGRGGECVYVCVV